MQGAGNTNRAFGQALRRQRQVAGLSQEELAARAGLHRTFVSLLERGLRNPSLDVVRRLAAPLGITAATLVALVEELSPR